MAKNTIAHTETHFQQRDNVKIDKSNRDNDIFLLDNHIEP
jgi:hypothetical protein